MKLSCTSWSFPACTRPEIAGILQALEIGAVDVGFFYRSSLDKEALLADPERAAGDLGTAGLDIANIYYLFGDDPGDRNLADPTHHDANEEDFRKLVSFCRAAGIPSIMLLPGVLNIGQDRRDALEESALVLGRLAGIAHEAQVVLTIEPHVHSYLESPSLVLELIERVPGLRLTLDYAHFVCLGYRQEEIDELVPHAAHVHLRQARPGALQAKFGEGTINFPALLATLESHGYDGFLSIEYVHQAYMNTLFDDVLTETVAMRDLVRGAL